MSEQILLIPGHNPEDGLSVDTDHGIFKRSGLLLNMLEDQTDCEEGISFTHPRNKETLEKVMLFCDWAKNKDESKFSIPEPIPKEVLKFENLPGMDPFLIEFMQVDKYKMSDLIMAAIEMDIT